MKWRLWCIFFLFISLSLIPWFMIQKNIYSHLKTKATMLVTNVRLLWVLTHSILLFEQIFLPGNGVKVKNSNQLECFTCLPHGFMLLVLTQGETTQGETTQMREAIYCLHTQMGWKPHCIYNWKHHCIRHQQNRRWKRPFAEELKSNSVTNWCVGEASLLCQVYPQVLVNNRLGLRCGCVIYWQIGVGVWWKITDA